MSTNYTDTLKKIKDAEEASNRQVAEKKKALEGELHYLEQISDESIESAKKAAEAYVTKATNDAKDAAQEDADALLSSTKIKAHAIASRKLDKKDLRKIVDEIIFSEFKSV